VYHAEEKCNISLSLSERLSLALLYQWIVNTALNILNQTSSKSGHVCCVNIKIFTLYII